MTTPVCTLLLTAAPLSLRAPHVAAALTTAGWQVATVMTPNAVEWVDADAVHAAAGSPPRVSHHDPDGPSPRAAGALVVCPTTFNTAGKAALGIADTYAHSLLCELLGARVPTLMVAMVNPKLWAHPAWAEHTTKLSRLGVRFLDPHTGRPGLVPVQSGTGERVTAAFDPAWVVAALGDLTRT